MPGSPHCREDNPGRAGFCWSCGAELAETPADAGEERKVVSVLFVDLVGFTAASEHADPEDVRARLRPYHARVKGEIERFGGTVEKFIGDAVMAVFGAPVAHEDDPERAVNAALRVVTAIADLNETQPDLALSVRAAINTGEAVVTLAARPGEGEAMVAGDVVNTAARMQQHAPINGVAVGESTYRATRDLFDYVELESVSAKGKSAPVALWHARAARRRFGVDVEPAARTPFIGRDDDLALLQSTYARTLRESSTQLVTITGEPGVGKTRLTSEFRDWVDDQPELVFWRQGRSLPYGEGITYWALGEMLKAQAGILESDPPEEALDKLAVAVREVAGDASEQEWLISSLAPLVGAADGSATSTPETAFSAWQRFLEGIAAQRPLIAVFEDLHWADERLLAFVEHLVDWSSGVPLLVLCTARPELYERSPGWGGGKRNSNTISLSPLGSEDTAPPPPPARGGGHGSPPCSLASTRGPTRRDADPFDRTCRRQPAVRRGVRAHARRHRAPDGRGRPPRRRHSRSRQRPGAHRGTTRHACGRAQGAPARRRRDREGVLERCGRRDGRRRRADRARRTTRARAQGARSRRARVFREGPDRVRVLARARARCRLFADPARRSCAQTRRRSGVGRTDGGRSGHRSRGAPRIPLRARAGACTRGRWRRRSATARRGRPPRFRPRRRSRRFARAAQGAHVL